jgi:arylsulfatase A
MRGRFSGWILLSVLAIGVCRGAERPNFLVILADDLGAAELACYGNTEHRTPNLDRLAARGVRFETAFACPVCHPSRFMIMTGQYATHNGVYNFPNSRGGPAVKDEGPDDITAHRTFLNLLHDAGYRTAVAGKWQLSGTQPNLIFECGVDAYRCWGYQEYYTPEDQNLAKLAGIVFRSRYWRPSIIDNGHWLPTTLDDYGEDRFADFVIDFMRQNRERPWLAYYPMVLTHNPWLPTPAMSPTAEEKEQNGRQHFAANVEYLDQVVGRVLAALEELGEAEETVVIFTGDNGTGFRGKSTATELGARVPMIVAGPQVRARPATKELTDLSDVLPTICELAGVALPQDRPLDGKSLAPFLRGQTASGPREWVFSYQGDYRILRTKRWLLENNTPSKPGRLFDCGEARDGRGYREVTDVPDAESRAARAMFDKLLLDLPAPVIEFDGPPNGPKDPIGKRRKQP